MALPQHSSSVTQDRRFRMMAALSGWLILRMAKYAAKRDDRHELAHLHAAIAAGDTTDCEWGCPTQTNAFPLDSWLSARSLTELPCECENADRIAYTGRDNKLHCSQCDGIWPAREAA